MTGNVLKKVRDHIATCPEIPEGYQVFAGIVPPETKCVAVAMGQGTDVAVFIEGGARVSFPMTVYLQEKYTKDATSMANSQDTLNAIMTWLEDNKIEDDIDMEFDYFVIADWSGSPVAASETNILFQAASTIEVLDKNR